MRENILEQLLSMTKDGTLKWSNFKDDKPKRVLDPIDHERVRRTVKYPSKVMVLRDGYNKYQSYYTFYDDLVLCLTKGERDDRILLIVGRVEIGKDAPPRKAKFKRDLSVITDEDSQGLVSQLHEYVHRLPLLGNEAERLSAIEDILS